MTSKPGDKCKTKKTKHIFHMEHCSMVSNLTVCNFCRSLSWRNSSPMKYLSQRSTRPLNTCFVGRASVVSSAWMHKAE